MKRTANKKELKSSKKHKSIKDDTKLESTEKEIALDEEVDVFSDEDFIEQPNFENERQTVVGDSKFRPPTAEEMLMLKDTMQLYKSSLFRFQIEELLKEVQFDFPKMIESTLHEVKSTLDSIESVSECSLADIISSLGVSDIKIPFPEPKPSTHNQLKFSFIKPSKIFIVGGYLLKSNVKSKNEEKNIDVAIQMPENLFQEKDYLNHRYFYKRSVYLAVVAREFNKNSNKLSLKAEFQYFNGDELRPILILRGSKDNSLKDISKTNTIIRILPLLPENVFNLKKLSPNKSCIRYTENDTLNNKEENNNRCSTPRYNTSILQDMGFVSHLNYLHVNQKKCQAFRETVILAKVWLKQRGYGTNGDFNSFIFSMCMAWLLNSGPNGAERRLMSTYSSFQLFKLTMEFLGNHDFEASPLFLTKNGCPISDTDFSKANFSLYDVAIVDPSGRINLAGHLSTSQILEFQESAKQTVRFLNDKNDDKFDLIFLKKVNVLHLEFDQLIKIDTETCKPPAFIPPYSLDYSSSTQFTASLIPKKLTAGLGTRLLQCSVRNSIHKKSWALDATPKMHSTFYVGLKIDQENSLRGVEYGPSAEKIKDVKAFKELWESKSELRRFKDGSIIESVVFENDGTFEGRSMTVSKMAIHLITLHCGIAARDIIIWSGAQFFPFLSLPGKSDVLLPNKSFKSVMDVFNSFQKKLKNYTTLPLNISTVQPCSPGLRYTSIFYPQPDNGNQMEIVKLDEALEVNLEFESSARWPDDFDAIQEMKLAFYLHLGKTITDDWEGSKATVSVNDRTQFNNTIQFIGRSILTERFLDVKSPEGYTFRCRIKYEREELLLEQLINPLPSIKQASTFGIATAKQTLQIYKHLFKLTPYYSYQIQQFCLRNPCLSFTIRLFKRWLSSHLFLNCQIPEIVPELLCCRAFMEDNVWSKPSSVFSGFIRVLHLITNFDWENVPCILEFEDFDNNSGINVDTIVEGFKGIRSNSSEKGGIGGGFFFIASMADPKCSIWEKGMGNNFDIVSRLITISKACLKHVNSWFENAEASDFAKMFLPATNFIDIKVNLNKSLIPKYYENFFYKKTFAPKKKITFKNLSNSTEGKLDKMEYLKYVDPVEVFFDEIRTANFIGDESKIFSMFYDFCGGDYFGLKLNKKFRNEVQEERKDFDFKVNLGFSSIPAAKKEMKGNKILPKVYLNFEGILAEIKKLGDDLVEGFEYL
ncbi:hypothetical protein HK099_006623 [Clydaea vesicula]|uniref:U3 small nucleolar RNA-associated protein 22 n=1 Tax=Clydaea vesicula TaxID=447962 RepID=A0AAD5XWV8_9FUNG|nr:hypothetical protein HK099_006623 [Clydaea vesicula]